MNYKSIPTETDAEIIGCGILTCMSIVSPLILFRFIKLVLLKLFAWCTSRGATGEL